MADTALKSRRRTHYPILQEYRTRWTDNDVYAHINNSIYYHLFDSIVNSHILSLPPSPTTATPQIGLVVHSHCDYFAPTSFPAVLDVGMRVKKLGKSSVTYETAVFEQGSEEVRAVGEFVHVYVGREGRKVLEGGMPAGIREALGGLVGRQAKL